MFSWIFFKLKLLIAFTNEEHFCSKLKFKNVNYLDLGVADEFYESK